MPDFRPIVTMHSNIWNVLTIRRMTVFAFTRVSKPRLFLWSVELTKSEPGI